MEQDPGTVVRQFSDTLEGQGPLEAGLKVAVQERIGQQNVLFKDAINSDNPFDELEVVRNALRETCTEYFASVKEKQRKRTIFKKHRASAENEIQERMLQGDIQTMDGVKAVVDSFEADWKNNQSNVSSRFHSVCKSLDAHKAVFSLFPSSNEYVAAFSGAVTMVVQASIYHEEIADHLSSAVAQLCQRAAACQELLPVIRTNEMKRQVADVYKMIFNFFLNAAKWFSKPAFFRVFDSFNAAILADSKSAQVEISAAIDHIMEKGNVTGLIWTDDIRHGVHNANQRLEKLGTDFEDLRMRVDESRAENRSWQEDTLNMGRRLASLLELIFQTRDREIKIQEQRELRIVAQHMLTSELAIPLLRIDEEQNHSQGMSREEADAYCTKLDRFLSGSDGLSQAQEARLLVTDHNIITRLGSWAQGALTAPRKLWIEFPFELQEATSASMAALGVIRTLALADAPFISYIPSRTAFVPTAQSQSPKLSGLLSVVYCLIRQLLRFRPSDDSFRADTDTLEQLDGGMESWKTGLRLLRDLLERTDSLRYCVIHGLNEFESETSEGLCRELVALLVDHSRQALHPLSLLFSTSGQSRVLHEFIGWEERVYTDSSTRMVRKRGENMDLLALQ